MPTMAWKKIAYKLDGNKSISENVYDPIRSLLFQIFKTFKEVIKILLICLMMIMMSLSLNGCGHKRKGDKLILSPVELIDLVRKEQSKNVRPDRMPKHFGLTTANNRLGIEDTDIDTTECEDAKALQNRKVWSRWSKWGACSVTCGDGAVTRRRDCVAGRCARGEHEEQRRPCARAPCRAAIDIFDDSREIE